MLGFRWTANFADQVDGNWPNGLRNVLARIWARTRPVSGATSKVNDMRQNKKYGDKEAKIYLLGSVDKKELVTSPFFQSLQYGKEGRMTNTGATATWCSILKTVRMSSRSSINNSTLCLSWTTLAGTTRRRQMA